MTNAALVQAVAVAEVEMSRLLVNSWQPSNDQEFRPLAIQCVLTPRNEPDAGHA
jgi:hypothetical protein